MNIVVIVGIAIGIFIIGFVLGWAYCEREWREAAYRRGWYPSKEHKNGR